MKKAPNGQSLLGALALSLAALFTACPSTPAQTAAEPSTPTPIAAELKPLQGYWEGEGAGGKCSITITGNSLHFHAGTNFWFETTFTLPAGTDPQQLHATIKDCSPPTNAIGTVVFAIFKIEDGTLTLADGRHVRQSRRRLLTAPRAATTLRRFSLKRRIPNHPKPNEPETP